MPYHYTENIDHAMIAVPGGRGRASKPSTNFEFVVLSPAHDSPPLWKDAEQPMLKQSKLPFAVRKGNSPDEKSKPKELQTVSPTSTPGTFAMAD